MSTKSRRSSSRMFTALAIAAVVLLAAFPLALNPTAEFAGTDDAASKVISEMNGDAEPWFHPVWAPPSGEIESMLFALQAAAGAGIIGYYFGLKRGQHYQPGRGQHSLGQSMVEDRGTAGLIPRERS